MEEKKKEVNYKEQRVNSLQEKINKYWTNPLGTWGNPEVIDNFGQKGFICLFYTIRALAQEVLFFCNKEEREKIKEYEEKIKDLIKTDENGMEKIYKVKINRDKRNYVLDHNKWNELKTLLESYEELARTLNKKYTYNPYAEDGI